MLKISKNFVEVEGAEPEGGKTTLMTGDVEFNEESL
jgi:hypothetical protein